jgi:hypothetical protein
VFVCALVAVAWLSQYRAVFLSRAVQLRIEAGARPSQVRCSATPAPYLHQYPVAIMRTTCVNGIVVSSA